MKSIQEYIYESRQYHISPITSWDIEQYEKHPNGKLTLDDVEHNKTFYSKKEDTYVKKTYSYGGKQTIAFIKDEKLQATASEKPFAIMLYLNDHGYDVYDGKIEIEKMSVFNT